jgi:hypothetical protein
MNFCGQGRVSIEVGKFIKGKNESSCGKGGVPNSLKLLSIFSRSLLNLYAN